MEQNAGDIFIEATKYPLTKTTDAALGRPAPMRQIPSWDTRVLPDPLIHHPMDLTAALQTRRSLRMFTGSAITEEQLSYLLWAAQGIIGESEMFRSSPSAGAIHPVDIYVAVQKSCWTSCGYMEILPEWSHAGID